MITVIIVPKEFSFWPTVYSHGWSALHPFEIDRDENCLIRVISLPGGKAVTAEIREKGKRALSVSVSGRISSSEMTEIRGQIECCLRLDEDFSEFYAESKKAKEFRWISTRGAGRMLRAPTVFEDAVKMICTTNCSWALTETMVGNLCRKLGTSDDGMRYAFPSADAIAAKSEKYLRREIRAGYRAPYLLELARRVADGTLKPEAWRSSGSPTAELFDEVRSVKGIGPYAAGNILKLLGRYDYLAIDSWCRKKFFEIHRGGRRVGDRAIEKHYERFGKLRGLFFWMDLTKDWYGREYPF